jgi:4-amino-4-deoxy-L-arabinose transferase-like glycosyltransferase
MAVLLTWSLLYLPHLRTSPRWYGDETLTLMIGKHLTTGEAADRSFRATFWHPTYPYQPGYAWLIGTMASFFRGDILGARFLNTLIALLIALITYFGGRAVLGSLPSLFAALLFLSYGQAVVHFRWIYPHNAVALGFLIACLALLRPSRVRADWGAGFGLALGALSHPLFVHGTLAAWLCRILRPKAWIRLAAPPVLVLALTIGVSVVVSWPRLWVFDDMRTLLEFFRSFSKENGSATQTLQNIAVFYSYDMFHFVSVFALLLCCRRRLYPIAIFGGTISLLLLQNRQNLPVFYYQAIVFLPILTLSWAGGLRTFSRWIRSHYKGVFLRRGVMWAALLLPLILIAMILPSSLRGDLISRNNIWVTQDISEVERAAAWINERVDRHDLVISNQNIGWLIDCQTADLLQVTAWEGRPTFGFPKVPERERFRYSADLARAKFVIIGDIDSRWTIHQDNVWPILERIGREKWPIVWSGQYYVIVRNPSYTERENHKGE